MPKIQIRQKTPKKPNQFSSLTFLLKPNKTLFDRTYSNLTSFFWSKGIKVFQ